MESKYSNIACYPGDGDLTVECSTTSVTITLADVANANLDNYDSMRAGIGDDAGCLGLVDEGGNLVFTFAPADCGATVSSVSIYVYFSQLLL